MTVTELKSGRLPNIMRSPDGEAGVYVIKVDGAAACAVTSDGDDARIVDEIDDDAVGKFTIRLKDSWSFVAVVGNPVVVAGAIKSSARINSIVDGNGVQSEIEVWTYSDEPAGTLADLSKVIIITLYLRKGTRN